MLPLSRISEAALEFSNVVYGGKTEWVYDEHQHDPRARGNLLKALPRADACRHPYDDAVVTGMAATVGPWRSSGDSAAADTYNVLLTA
jgi:hypothetical protein